MSCKDGIHISKTNGTYCLDCGEKLRETLDTNDIDNLFELYKFENMMRPLLQEEGYDLVEFKQAIQNLIAQETNKARIDELNKVYDWELPDLYSQPYLEAKVDARIKELTADKEEAA